MCGKFCPRCRFTREELSDQLSAQLSALSYQLQSPQSQRFNLRNQIPVVRSKNLRGRGFLCGLRRLCALKITGDTRNLTQSDLPVLQSFSVPLW